MAAVGVSENKYYEHFKAVVGRGDGGYYANMGHVYKVRPGIQRGFGHYTVGARLSSRQRGTGFGSTIMSMFRMAVPILKALGSKAVNVVSNIAQDAIQGSNIKDSAVLHTKNEVGDIMAKAPGIFKGLVTKASDAIGTQISQPVSAASTTTPPTRALKRKATFRRARKQTKRQRGGQYSAGLALLQ